MRILKYFFLLLLLALVAITVFVATQKGTYNIERSRVIKSPRSIAFDYVNEFRNWENFGHWVKEDPTMKFTYPAVTSGKGASYSWTSESEEGSMQTIFTKPNDSISQKMIINGASSQVSWKFKDTIGGTKVIWRSKGRMNFMYKIYAVSKGGINKLMGTMYEQSLANLDKTINYEMKTFNVAENGIVVKSGAMFLQQSINSTIENAPRNMKILLSKMTYFFKKNNIKASGKPFVIYHTYDTATDLTKFSVGIPINQEVRTSAGSDVTFSKFDSFRAVKVTLTGDYSHRTKAWQKAADYISQNKLQGSTNMKAVEIFSKGIENEKSPSKWITHIYFPLQQIQATAVKKIATTAVQLPVAKPPVTQPTQPKTEIQEAEE